MNNKKRLSNKESDLYRAILELKTPQECYEFFSDLCTVAELKAMEQRFEIARMLMQGMIYNDILEISFIKDERRIFVEIGFYAERRKHVFITFASERWICIF